MIERIRAIRMPLSTKIAGVATLVFSAVGLLVLAALLALAVTAPLTPVDIVWLMACCAALFVPLHYFIFNNIARSLISKPLEDITETARDLGRAPLPTTIPVEDELDELTVALVRSGEALSERMRGLQKENTQHTYLFESLPGLVSVQDRDFRVVQCNRAFSETFNTNPGDPCRKACNRHTAGMDCPVARTFKDGTPRILVEHSNYPNGTSVRWLVAISPMYTDDALTHAIELRLDISEIHTP